MQVKRLALDFGHSSLTPVPRDTGAVGILKEDDCIRELHRYLVPELLAIGYEITVCVPEGTRTLGGSLRERVRIANASKADLFISFHFNAFSSPSANGTEVFVSGARSQAIGVATKILNNVCSLGYFNRGLKYGDFYVIENTDMPAILFEGCFMTNKEDCDRFQANSKEMAAAIIAGLSPRPITNVPKEIKVEEGKLVVLRQTLLKPSTDQSVNIDPNKMEVIIPGEYECKFVGEEEGHYLLKFENNREWFIFGGHANFIAAN